MKQPFYIGSTDVLLHYADNVLVVSANASFSCFKNDNLR